MFKLSRFAVAALLFAGAGIALAQPPGPGGGGRGGVEKKDFPRKEGERPPAEALERELQQLRTRISEVEAQLKQSREGGANREEPKREGPRGGGVGSPTARGPGAAGNPFAPGRAAGGPGDNPLVRGAGGPGGFGGGIMGPGGPGGDPFDRMSAEQIKQMIGRLQSALEAKNRTEPKQNQEDVMKRLERIQKELEDIRRSLGK